MKQAYLELERQGRVCARPQSGYYLMAQQARTLKPMPTKWSHCAPVTVQCRNLIEQVLRGCSHTRYGGFGDIKSHFS